MLIFDRPNFNGGVCRARCPEMREVEEAVLDENGEKIKLPKGGYKTKKVMKEVMVEYKFRTLDKGKEFKFPKEEYMLKHYPLFWRGTKEWTHATDRKKEIQAKSAERKKLIEEAEKQD